MRSRRALQVIFAAGVAAAYSSPSLDDYESYPKRSEADAAVIEWGHSAMIQSVDAVVAAFGSQISETEAALFEVEASIVMARPPQACGAKGALVNEDDLRGQIALVMRGGCSFATKAAIAVKAGAAALVVINNDAASPDHTFAMDNNDLSEVAIDIPCVMVSYNGGQALLTDDPSRVRLYAGAGRPFIETVSDASPVLYLIHNLLTPEECERLKVLASSRVQPSNTVGAEMNSTQLVLGVWKDSVLQSLDEKISSVIGYPSSYFADLQVNRYEPGGRYEPHYDWAPSLYQEQVMTLLLCLDDVAPGDGGETIFPYATPPVKVAPRSGLAVVVHLVDDDGEPCPHSINGQAPMLNGISWNANQWIFATPMPFARRVVVPTMLLPFRSVPPALMLTFRSWVETHFGGDTGFLVFNWSATLLLATVVAAVIGTAATTLKATATTSRKR